MDITYSKPCSHSIYKMLWSHRRWHAHVCSVTSVMFNLLRPHGLWPARLLCPWDSPGKNTGVGCHALLQGIFPTQGSDLPLLRPLHWQESSSPLVPPIKHEESEGIIPNLSTKGPHSFLFCKKYLFIWMFQALVAAHGILVAAWELLVAVVCGI